MKHLGLVKPNSTFSFQVTADESNSRIDKFICAQFPYYSRSYFQQLIDKGHIRLNDKMVTKPSISINESDKVTIVFPTERSINVSREFNEKNIAIDIIHENKHFLIINKPANFMVHPPNQTDTQATVVDWILANYKDIKKVGCIDRPGIVHRLDKDTSGILIIPRTNYAHGIFGQMFKDRTIKKTYHAIVQGHPDPKGTIKASIGRDPVHRNKMKAFPEDYDQMTMQRHNIKVRRATTHYKVLEYFDNAALVELKPITGRTHQIRVHLASIGHPIIGDKIYGKESKLIKRQALHATNISFEFDDFEHEFKAECPADFSQLINLLHHNKNNPAPQFWPSK